MSKYLFSLGLFFLASVSVAQITTTVSVGAGYTDQKWYSLANGEQAGQPKDNWDLAFEITGYSSAILANTQKANFAVYKAPFSIANYATVDTAGITNWPVLYNSDTTWTIGAFNKGANPGDQADLGWGNYDMSTHFVTGDSCYVIRLSAASYKKIKIVNLAGGVYTFEYADISGANSFTQAIAKSAYPGKNFAYFNLTSNSAVDREPASPAWDLTFGRYTAMVMAPNPTPYPVVGIIANKGVQVAQVNNVPNPVSFNDWTSQSYVTNISTIGHDWKTVDISTGTWKVVNDTVYFVKDKQGDLWKLRFVSFGGATNGNYVFTKEKLTATSIADKNGKKIAQVVLFPNPSDGANTSLLISGGAGPGDMTVSVTDLSGKLISSEKMKIMEGWSRHELRTRELQPGIYMVSLNAGSYSAIHKLIIQ